MNGCRAYKLGKERWSYNQLKIEIHDTMRGYHLDPKLAKTVSCPLQTALYLLLPCQTQ